VLPIVTELASRHPERTVFTRFIPPERAADMPGMWQRYYTRWKAATREQLDAALLELIAAPGHVESVVIAGLDPPASGTIHAFMLPSPVLRNKHGPRGADVQHGSRTRRSQIPSAPIWVLGIVISAKGRQWIAHASDLL